MERETTEAENLLFNSIIRMVLYEIARPLLAVETRGQLDILFKNFCSDPQSEKYKENFDKMLKENLSRSSRTIVMAKFKERIKMILPHKDLVLKMFSTYHLNIHKNLIDKAYSKISESKGGKRKCVYQTGQH